MKRKRLIIYIVVLILMICFIGVGVASLIMQNKYKNNNVEFELNDAQAYCIIDGKYFINGHENTDKAYLESYQVGSEYDKNGFDGFPMWNIGESRFEISEENEQNIIKFEIKITNLNANSPISVILKDVAVGEEIDGGNTYRYFNTKITYKLGEETAAVKFNNKEGEQVNYESYINESKVVDVPLIELAAYNSANPYEIQITIEFERVEKVKRFDFDNNFKIILDTVK